MTGPLALRGMLDGPDDEEPNKTANPVSVGITADGINVKQAQIMISLAEAKAMQRMDGGMCLTNWLRIRGLVDEPFKES